MALAVAAASLTAGTARAQMGNLGNLSDPWLFFDPGPWLTYDLGPMETRLGGRFVLDASKYSYANPSRSGVDFTEIRPRLSGRMEGLTWLVEGDAVGLRTPHHLYEAWASYEFFRALRLTAGQLRVAFGTEFATDPANLPFHGLAFPSYLDGRYDLGARLDGELFGPALFYEATATTGDGFGLEGHRRRSPLYALRLLVHPLGWLEDTGSAGRTFLRGLYAGFAEGRMEDFDDPVILATPDRHVVFMTPDLAGRAGSLRHMEAGLHGGPWRASWELAHVTAADVPIPTGREDMDQLTSWQAAFAWNLTGQEQVLRRGRWEGGPRNGFALLPADWIPGRLEASVRYANADVDRDLFNYGFTNYVMSTQEVRTFSTFLSWAPFANRSEEKLRLGFGFVRTIADHELAKFGGTNRDSTYTFRIELDL